MAILWRRFKVVFCPNFIDRIYIFFGSVNPLSFTLFLPGRGGGHNGLLETCWHFLFICWLKISWKKIEIFHHEKSTPNDYTYNQYIYYKFLLYYQNEDVYEKPDLNIFKIDWALVIYKFRISFLKFFWKFLSLNENRVNLVNFEDRIEQFFITVTDGPLLIYIGQHSIQGS